MRGDLSVPPRRDLPPGRLAQRREHLLFEITRSAALAKRSFPRGLRGRGGPVGGAARARGGRARRDRRNRLCDRQRARLHPRSGASSACLPWERRRARRRAGSSSSAGWGGARPTREDAIAAPLVRAWVYADGRIIWSEESSQSSRPVPEGANEFTSGYLEQRLTPEGVELLRSEVIGLLERSRIRRHSPRRSVRPTTAPPFVPHSGRPGIVTCATATGSSALHVGARLHAPEFEGSRDAGAACGSPTGRRAAHRPGVGAAAERVGRAQDQGVRADALRSVHRQLAAEGCVSAPVPAAGAGRGRAPRQEPDTARRGHSRVRRRGAGPSRCRADRSRTAPS